MQCALCRKNEPLRQSHVIPEFLYTPLYDEKHRFHVLSPQEAKRHQFGQKGFRERLLCAACEAHLSKYERYASHVFSGRIPMHTERKGNLITVRGLDYTKFRLFGLSILWRAGVSKDRMFESVNLGPHQESLRLLILRGDPSRPNHYGFFLSPLVLDEKDMAGLIVMPTRSRLGNNLCYRFVFGGLIWTYLVSKHAPPKPFGDAFVNENGEMLMLVSELRDVPFITNAISDMMEATRGSASLRRVE